MFVPHPRFSHIHIQVTAPPLQATTAGRSPQLEHARRLFALDPLGTSDYGRSIRDILNYIAGFVTGEIILRWIQANGRRVDIVPYPPMQEHRVNATASPNSGEAATPRGREILHCSGPETGQPTGILFPTTGTGTGSDVTVRFSAHMWTSIPGAHIQSTGRLTGAGSRSDEVLLHELLHGFRQMQGRMHCTSTGDRYDTFEEYFAIVVTNMYVSNVSGRSNTPLRADHHTFNILPFATLFPDSAVNQERLRRIRREGPEEFVMELARRSPATFNPFRELFVIDQPSPTGAAAFA